MVIRINSDFYSASKFFSPNAVSGDSKNITCKSNSIAVGMFSSKSNCLKIWNSAYMNISTVYSILHSFFTKLIVSSKSRIQFSFIFTAKPKHVPAIRKYISYYTYSFIDKNLSKSFIARRVVLSRNPYTPFVLIIHWYTYCLHSRGTALTSEISPFENELPTIFFSKSTFILYLKAYFVYFLPVCFTKWDWLKYFLLFLRLLLIYSYICYC